MRRSSLVVTALLLTLAFVPQAYAAKAASKIVKPSPDAQRTAQEALILAKPGDIIEFSEGRFEFTSELSSTVNGVTIRGKGMDKTVLTFKNQNAGTEGLAMTGDGLTIQDLAIEDSKGNAFKSKGSKGINLIRVRAEWTGGPKSTNGAYGLYPVESENVLIEDCVVKGASDSGIYVGQSKNIIVRKCRVEYNVAGIEIENCYGADVYDNTATHNTGGILVFDMPDLPMQGGRDVRVFRNNVENNDTANFAPQGNMVATVPRGTGIIIMANHNVEIFENIVEDHLTTGLLIISYLTTGKPLQDAKYYPYPEGIYVHNNTFTNSGKDPDGFLGEAAAGAAGKPLPDMLWDGVVNEAKLVNGKLPKESGIYFDNNGAATFVNLELAHVDVSKSKPTSVKRDLAAHAGTLPRLAAIKIPGVK